MAIFIREYVGGIKAHNVGKHGAPTNLKEKVTNISSSCATKVAKGSLMQVIEGIHVGCTRNFTWYTEQALKDSESGWTSPYLRPLIMHHNEDDGKIIGRIHQADYITEKTRSGSPALRFLCNIPDKEGKEQVQDGRLSTTSIGVIAHDARCSICNEQIEIDENTGESTCGHIRGAGYEGNTCYWMIYQMEPKELSYVIVPSDIYAHNLEGWIVGEEKTEYSLAESSLANGGKTVKKNEIKEALKASKPIETSEGVIINTNGEASNSSDADQRDLEKKEGDKEDSEEIKDKNKTKEGEENGEEKSTDKEEGRDKEEVLKENEELKSEIEKIKAVVKELKGIITLAQETISEFSKEIEDKDALVEAAEDEALIAKQELREYIEADIETMQDLTDDSNKLSRASLAVETKESLIKKAITLREAVKEKTRKVVISKAEDITLKKTEIKENASNVKKTNTKSNLRLEEALNGLYN